MSNKKNSIPLIITLAVIAALLTVFIITTFHNDTPEKKNTGIKATETAQNPTAESFVTETPEITLTDTPTPSPSPTPTNTPTPVITPDVSKIDANAIESKYIAEPDIDGLEIIDQSSLGDTSAISYMKGRTEKGAVIEIINGVTFVNGLLMVNKTYKLPSTYVPQNNHENLTGQFSSLSGLYQPAWDAWTEMAEAAKAEGIVLNIISCYRSSQTQDYLYNNYVNLEGAAAADTYSARPGHSEHQSGLCFDLNSLAYNFAFTAEGKWLNDNCYKYGFCIRFPYGKDDLTGYLYESWHLRYVGTELAEKLYNNGEWLCMEEFFGLESKYT